MGYGNKLKYTFPNNLFIKSKSFVKYDQRNLNNNDRFIQKQSNSESTV